MQIDLLMQTARAAYIIEIKRQNRIGREIEAQLEEKMKRFHARKGMSVRPVLVYAGELSREVEGDGFFDAIIPAERLLKKWEDQTSIA